MLLVTKTHHQREEDSVDHTQAGQIGQVNVTSTMYICYIGRINILKRKYLEKSRGVGSLLHCNIIYLIAPKSKQATHFVKLYVSYQGSKNPLVHVYLEVLQAALGKQNFCAF